MNDQAVPKTILIVDDETPFILSLTTGIKNYTDDYNILTAGNGKQAVEILESSSVDLVVTDLRMPDMDGFDLLAYMSSTFPSIPAIVMSAYGTQEIKDRLHSMGTLGFLEKPVDFQDLITSINDGLRHDQEGGSLNGISIGSFLQLIEMEEKTCLLEIKGENKSANGIFYFNKGVLYDAICGKLRGEEAALEVIGWENAEIQFKELPKKKISRRIETDLMYLIMEAMRIKDEFEIEEEDLIEIEDVTEELDDRLDQDLIQEEPISEETSHPEKEHQENQNDDSPKDTGKEMTMNVQKLNAAVEILKEDLGDALLATDIFGSADGQSIAGYNPQPKASALFSQLTAYLTKALEGAGFPGLGRYYLLNLAGDKMVIDIPLGDFQWGMLIDSKKGQLGLLLNVVLPKVIDAFEEAITG